MIGTKILQRLLDIFECSKLKKFPKNSMSQGCIYIMALSYILGVTTKYKKIIKKSIKTTKQINKQN